MGPTGPCHGDSDAPFAGEVHSFSRCRRGFESQARYSFPPTGDRRVSAAISGHMYPPGEDRDSTYPPAMLNSAMQTANVQTSVELSSLTGTKSVTLGTYLRGRTIPPLQKC